MHFIKSLVANTLNLVFKCKISDKCAFMLVSENEGSKSYQIDLAKADLEIKKYYHIKLK